MSAAATPAHRGQNQTVVEDEIHQLRALVNLLAIYAAFSEDRPDYVFGVRAEYIDGLLQAMQRSSNRLYVAFHGEAHA